MKRKYILVPIIAGAAMITACKDKSSTDSGGSDNPKAPAAADSNAGSEDSASALTPSASPEQRAAKLGFAKHLPNSVVAYSAVFNGKEAFREFLKTPIGVFILQRLAEEEVSLEDILANEQFASQIAMYSEEYFTAYGEGATETYQLVSNLIYRLAYYGGKFGVYAADGYVREGEDFRPSGPAEILNGPLKGGPKELVKLFGEFNIPSVYQGSKVSNEETRDMAAGQLEEVASLFSMAGEASEPVTVKRNGVEFTGYKIIGAKLAEQISDSDKEEMQDIFEADDVNSFVESLKKKNIVFLSGVIDDYVILFLGKHEDDFQLAESLTDSFCAKDELAYLDKYLGKNIVSVGYSDAKIADTMNSFDALSIRFLNSLTQGLKEGLGNAESLGDTQDVEALLDSLTEQGKKLAGMFKASDLGYVAFIEDGLRAEGFGGSNMPSIDFDSTHSLSGLESGSNTFLFANWTTNQDYNEKALEYLDTLGETSFLVAKRVAALDIDNTDEFKQSLELFDSKFKKDLLGLWQAFRLDLSGGLGAEFAVVVDMNGALPKVPNVPDVLLKEGKMPRISYVSTVRDRSKLQDSWNKINTSTENILKTISEMAGNEIPMQVPMSSEKDDLKTWFVPIPFQNDDFVPSVSVSDELFFVSTSKTFSEGLAEKFKSGEKTDRKGAWIKVDFTVLNAYLQEWLNLVEKNAGDVFPSDAAREDFVENKPMIADALKAFSSLDSLTLHTRREAGQTRVSLHIKGK